MWKFRRKHEEPVEAEPLEVEEAPSAEVPKDDIPGVLITVGLPVYPGRTTEAQLVDAVQSAVNGLVSIHNLGVVRFTYRTADRIQED